MDKNFEKGPDKVKQIVQLLRTEALEPAKHESQQIIDEANQTAEKIIREGEQEVERMIAAAQKRIEQERNVFQSSLTQAAKQGIESLKQQIEHELFDKEISNVIEKGASDSKIVAQLINAVCTALEKEGLSTNISAAIPKKVSVDEVNSLLVHDIVKRLKGQSVVIGDFNSGAQIKVIDKKMTIDLSDQALRELLANYVRKDFRKLIFGS